MWRFRSIAKLSRFCSELRRVPANSSRNHRLISSYTRRLPCAEVTTSHFFVRDFSTRTKRASTVGDSGSEFSESDELEQESRDLQELEVDSKEGAEDDEEEEVKVEITDDEIGDEAAASRETNKFEPLHSSRSFGRAEAPLTSKSQELWVKINTLPRGEKVVPILESWKEEGNELDQGTLVAIVGRLQRITRYGLALEIVEWLLEQDEFKDSSALRGSAIEFISRCKGIAAAEKYFEDLAAEEKTRPVYDAMLSQLVNKAQVKKAEALFDEMEKAGYLSGSPFAINAMMRLYKQSRSNKKFQEMLEKAKEANVQPNIQTYNVMLDLKCKEGDIAGMEKVFDEIKANPETKPDAVTYTTLARAYLKAGMHEKAELYMLRLENGPFRKSKRTYEILIDFYAELGNQQEVERMWSKCRTIQGDGATSYLIFMHALSKLGAVDKVEKMFQRIDSWKPNKITEERRYNNLLLAYHVAGDKVKAEELEKRMKEAGIAKNPIKLPKKEKQEASKTPTETVKAKAKKEAKSQTKEPKSAENRAKQAENFAQRLDAAIDKGNVKQAEVIFEECRRAKLSDVEMWNRLLKVYVKAGMPAYGFSLRMSADKVEANDETKRMLEGMAV